MSATMTDSIKRWTAKRKTALLAEILPGKTTVAEALRADDPSPSEIEGWVDDARQGMEHALRPTRWRSARQTGSREGLAGGPWRGPAGAARQKSWLPRGAGGRRVIRTLHAGFPADRLVAPLTRLCVWFGVPRRTVYSKPTKVDRRFADPIKAMIAQEPSFGDRMPAWLTGIYT